MPPIVPFDPNATQIIPVNDMMRAMDFVNTYIARNGGNPISVENLMNTPITYGVGGTPYYNYIPPTIFRPPLTIRSPFGMSPYNIAIPEGQIFAFPPPVPPPLNPNGTFDLMNFPIWPFTSSPPRNKTLRELTELQMPRTALTPPNPFPNTLYP